MQKHIKLNQTKLWGVNSIVTDGVYHYKIVKKQLPFIWLLVFPKIPQGMNVIMDTVKYYSLIDYPKKYLLKKGVKFD